MKKPGRQKDEFTDEITRLKTRKRLINHCLAGNPIYTHLYRPEVGRLKLIDIEKRILEIGQIRLNKIHSEGEIWKPIHGSEGHLISNYGRVKTEYGSLMTPCLRGERKLYLGVTVSGKSKTIHRLVATAFIPNPNNLPEVNHKDLNKMNNRWDNLEWCTRKENMEHAAKGGRIIHGSKHRSAKLSDEKARQIRAMFKANPNLSQSAIARQIGIDSSNICRLLKGKYWKHVL